MGRRGAGAGGNSDKEGAGSGLWEDQVGSRQDRLRGRNPHFLAKGETEPSPGEDSVQISRRSSYRVVEMASGVLKAP